MSGKTRHCWSCETKSRIAMEVALFEPEIPPNTGNIARLCAFYGICLNLIEPLGFSLEDRYLRRAGLDYWPNVKMKIWNDWQTFQYANQNKRMVLATTKATSLLPDFQFLVDDVLVFGPETRGLPAIILNEYPWRVRIPGIEMEAGGARSLNLATACGIFVYAALIGSGLMHNYT